MSLIPCKLDFSHNKCKQDKTIWMICGVNIWLQIYILWFQWQLVLHNAFVISFILAVSFCEHTCLISTYIVCFSLIWIWWESHFLTSSVGMLTDNTSIHIKSTMPVKRESHCTHHNASSHVNDSPINVFHIIIHVCCASHWQTLSCKKRINTGTFGTIFVDQIDYFPISKGHFYNEYVLDNKLYVEITETHMRA